MARTMAEPDEMNQYPVHPQAGYQQRHPGNMPYPGRDHSLRYRETGLYSNTSSPTSPTRAHPPSSHTRMYTRDSNHGQESPMTSPSPWGYHDADHDRDDTHYVSSAATTPFTSFNRTSDSTAGTSLSTLDESPTPSQLPSPRWDSLGHSNVPDYSQPKIPTHNYNVPHETTTNVPYDHPHSELQQSSSLASEARDEFPPLRSPTASIFESRYPTTEPASPRSVSNFSRPRNASNRQMYEDIRLQPSHVRSEPSRPDVSPNHTASSASWPRERGQSISSNQSASTFASLPIRPSLDITGSDSPRSRSRHGTPSSSRPPISYSRLDGSGPLYGRDPIPRMASLPSEELRASYRSHRSSSTAHGTSMTERSSFGTKDSSMVSMWEPMDDQMEDDGISVDDVLGLYDAGFDDSAPEDNDEANGQDEEDTKPEPAEAEERRRTMVLEAMTAPPRIPAVMADVSGSNPLVRDSAAMFRASGLAAPLPETDVDTDTADATTVDANDNLNNNEKHDSGKLVDDDSDDEFEMRRPKRQQTDMTLTLDVDRDRYGFRKETQYITKEQFDTWDAGYTDYLARRRRKWVAYLKENGLMTDNPNRFPPRSAKAKRFIRKGIPPDWRGAAWFYYAGGPAILSKHAGLYDELLKRNVKAVDLEAIERDLHRTFPDNIKFRSSQTPPTPVSPEEPQDSENTPKDPQGNPRRPETPMISSLRRVLHAFAVYNPQIGYCQSLNFLAGMLLLFVETEEYAFWLLNIITRVFLPGTHEISLEGANVDLGVLMCALREHMPAVWAKIGGELDGTDTLRPSRSRRNRVKQPMPARLPPITLCMTAWFMSCFIGTLPTESTLRVWDIFFYEGSRTIFRIAMTIFKLGESEIRAVGDPMEIFQVVQTIPRKLLNANALIEACFKRRNGFGNISQEEIDRKRNERREQVKREKEKATRGESAAGETGDLRKGALFGRRREQTLPVEAT